MKLTALLLIACSSLATASNEVWVVDRAGGGDFTRLQSAVDAADSGDTILIKPGWYLGATVQGKGLQILGLELNSVFLMTQLFISGQAPDQDVYLANLEGAFSLGTPGVSLPHQANVLIDTCLTWRPSPHGIQLAGSFHSLTVVNCELYGVSEPACCAGCGWPGSAIMRTAESTSRLFMFQSATWGGSGSDGCVCWSCEPAGAGQIGIDFYGDLLFTAMSSLYGGSSGCGCGGGGNGAAVVVTLGRHDQSTAPDSRLRMPFRVTEGGSVQVEVEGDPGSSVSLLSNDRLGSRYLGAQTGALLLAPNPRSLPIGTIGGNGTLHYSFAAPVLAPSDEGQMIYFQAVLTDLQGNRSLSNPKGLLILDAIL